MRRGLLAGRDELRALGDKISIRPFDRIYDRLRKRCSLILESAPITETQWRSLWMQGRRLSALTACQSIQGRLLDLIIAHHIDSNDAYRDRAIEELTNLVGWSTWTDPCHESLTVDLCTSEAAATVAVALDWLWEDLDESLRAMSLQALRQKAIDPYLRAVADKEWWYSCYHNWNAVVNSGCGLAGLALGDEQDEAQKVYELARTGLKHFFDALGKEGGWDEGIGYWAYAMRYILLFGEATASVYDDQKIFHERGMDTTGLFPIYFTPNGYSAGFGDFAIAPAFGAMYSLVKRYEMKELAWWLDTYTFHHDVSTTGWSHAGLAMLFRPPDLDTPEKPLLEPVKVFDQIGWATMADNWPKPTFYASAKTGDLSAHHSQCDMNTINLQVDGEMILADMANVRDHNRGPQSEFYDVQARAHNTIVVADDDHQIDARGQIVESGYGKNFRWLTCDAKHACGENVRFVRHLVMIVDPSTQAGRSLIVLDEINNAVPERISQYWHTHGRWETKDDLMSGTIIGNRTKMHFALASTVKASAHVETYNLRPGSSDNVLYLSAGVINKAYFAGIFSRRPIKGKAEIIQSKNKLTVWSGDTKLHFSAGKGHLMLKKAVTSDQ